MSIQRYITTEKKVGETPLIALERARVEYGISKDIPLAYAGRLDPMAEGRLLILVGDECKVQEKYHSLDKTYEVEVLFGVGSDTGDVLGLVETHPTSPLSLTNIREVLNAFVGPITLPYPHFSSKTVQGKPLHVWTLEGRLNEIEIPRKTSTIHTLTQPTLRTITKEELLSYVREKIETIPKVTEESKALGADFRRDTVRKAWNTIEVSQTQNFQILSFTCIASSGTYMRTLAEEIAKKLGTRGIALSIKRTHIGRYVPLFKNFGFWLKVY